MKLNKLLIFDLIIAGNTLLLGGVCFYFFNLIYLDQAGSGLPLPYLTLLLVSGRYYIFAILCLLSMIFILQPIFKFSEYGKRCLMYIYLFFMLNFSILIIIALSLPYLKLPMHV